ncbi:hypothetical protein Y1Q_0001921 [Alligator mississippiensis]|uniref:Uncharacterized protein n=1 Tax=Alligator mississippiensis TaxID=8496 RepID=A0A151PG91_ALLMI|nr:hypothetical protein Y1Q_0001921 [Alligator mississippiensis]
MAHLNQGCARSCTYKSTLAFEGMGDLDALEVEQTCFLQPKCISLREKCWSFFELNERFATGFNGATASPVMKASFNALLGLCVVLGACAFEQIKEAVFETCAAIMAAMRFE